uniref:Uncharacterized protein n=1 Tax=Oryza glumipatula TaxID=40148 RepID=A0A0D9ZLN8_9ORYZ
MAAASRRPVAADLTGSQSSARARGLGAAPPQLPRTGDHALGAQRRWDPQAWATASRITRHYA